VPDQQALADAAPEWRRDHDVRPSAADEVKVHLLLIDVQKDFCFPEGTLYVGGRTGTGAIDDSRRIAEFIYRNLDRITDVTTTMDTHFAYQIFSPAFWVDDSGENPAPHTVVTLEDVMKGRMRPNPMVAKWLCRGNYSWLTKQVQHYCRELEKAGKYQLYLWPPHCVLGSAGHSLVGVIHEARMTHSLVRGAQSWVEVKGGNPLTENYSVLRPEVLTRHDGGPLAQRNTQFLERLLAADALVIAGQAASHCVKSSIDDLLDEIVSSDPGLARKVYVMTDCMSSVAVPDGNGGFVADFTEEADKAQQRFADAGMHLVRSTDPIESWPGLQIR
jgi:nicotinamidase-related amidase